MSDALKTREALISDIMWRISNVHDLRDHDVRAPIERAVRTALSALDQPSGVRRLDVDRLAQEIRHVDGKHSLGAGELAEALMPFLSALDLSAIGAEGWKPTHRHKSRGTEYALLGIGKMQAGTWTDPTGSDETVWKSVDMREVAIYRGADGQLWVRPRDEFEDGRFEPLPSPPEPRT